MEKSKLKIKHDALRKLIKIKFKVKLKLPMAGGEEGGETDKKEEKD